MVYASCAKKLLDFRTKRLPGEPGDVISACSFQPPLQTPLPDQREVGYFSQLLVPDYSLWTRLNWNHSSYLWPCGDSLRVETRPVSGCAGGHVQQILCLRCRREIEAGGKSVAVYMFAQTVGVRPRQKSAANRICFCPQCAVSLAMGMPPEGALNMAAWDMIRDLVSAEPSLNQAAWESLRGVVGLLPSGDENGSGRYRRAG